MAKSKFEEAAGYAGESGEPVDDAVQAAAQTRWSSEVHVPEGAQLIPFMTLVQGNSRLDPAVAKPGQWYVEGFGSVANPILVPLRFGMSRQYSRNNQKGEPETACYAPTGPYELLHGVAKTSDGPGMVCAECPLAKWTDSGEIDENGKPINNPPVCKESYDFACWSVDFGIPVRVGFKSSGVKAGRLVAQLGSTKGLGNFAIKAGSVRKTDKFTYYAPTVVILQGDDAEMAISEGAPALLSLPG